MATLSRLQGRGLYIALSVASVMFLASCQGNTSAYNMPQLQQDPLVVPAGFPKPVIPADNPLTPAKVALGRQLFYDTKLSRDNSVSCASCHQQSASFSDAGKNFSVGVGGATGTRNAPALVNLIYDTTFFWDGRAHSLEQQAIVPILNPVEMASDSTSVISNLSKDGYTVSLFQTAFGDGKITMGRIGQAIASFERTMISSNSRYDQYKAGNKNALNASEIRGLTLFEDTTQTNCTGCHSGVNLTDNGFYSTGFQPAYYGGDPGREAVTKNPSDQGKFRTPTLRNVALSAPYAANGGTATLMEMMQHYNDGGLDSTRQDRRIHKLYLTDAQLTDMVNFLQSLTDQDFIHNQNFSKPTNN